MNNLASAGVGGDEMNGYVATATDGHTTSSLDLDPDPLEVRIGRTGQFL
jgi:hypothetical protein